MEPRNNEGVIRRLYEISTQHDQGFTHQVTALLEVGLDRFGLEIGILSRIGMDAFVIQHVLAPADFGIAAGDRLSLDDTFGRECLAAEGPVGEADLARSRLASLPAYTRWGLAAYIGVPVLVEGKPYGTLSFSSRSPRPDPFDRGDLDILNLMGSWLGSELARIMKEEALRKAEESFRIGIEASPAGMIMVDPRGSIVYANAEALRLFDYRQDELLAAPIEILVPESARAHHPALREEYFREGAVRHMGAVRDLYARRRDGTEFPVEIGLNPIENPYGRFTLCTVMDLTERKRQEQKILDQSRELQRINEALAEQAVSDILTGLTNRRGLYAHMETILRLARRGGHPTSLLMLDVDHFKDFNDAHGHPAGDEALKAVAATLGETVRRSDIVARYGGEEFVVMLPETELEGGLEMAERIRQRVAAITDLDRPLTVSIGVATLAGTAARSGARDLAENLIREADKALYNAKHAGRDRVAHFGSV